MGRMVVFVGILSVLCCSVFAQSKGRPSASTEQAVMGIERELLNAILKADVSASERYLADTYVFTGPDGTVENKAQAIADLKIGRPEAPIRVAGRCQGASLRRHGGRNV